MDLARYSTFLSKFSVSSLYKYQGTALCGRSCIYICSRRCAKDRDCRLVKICLPVENKFERHDIYLGLSLLLFPTINFIVHHSKAIVRQPRATFRVSNRCVVVAAACSQRACGADDRSRRVSCLQIKSRRCLARRIKPHLLSL
jgi:hypothetical protein